MKNKSLIGYTTWDEICPDILLKLGLNYSSQNVHSSHKGLSMGGRLPHSISEYEFNYMKDFISKHDLKSGFECATGAGISTVAIGAGFQNTGGHLFSIDSYVESQEGREVIYQTKAEWGGSGDSTAFENNKKLIDFFGLSKTVTLRKGIAPDDCTDFTQEEKFPGLDFVFLDGPKEGRAFIEVMDFVKPLLVSDGSPFAIFFHDTHMWIKKFQELCKEYFEVGCRLINRFPTEDGGTAVQLFPLTVITNLPAPGSTSNFEYTPEGWLEIEKLKSEGLIPPMSKQIKIRPLHD